VNWLLCRVYVSSCEWHGNNWQLPTVPILTKSALCTVSTQALLLSQPGSAAAPWQAWFFFCFSAFPGHCCCPSNSKNQKSIDKQQRCYSCVSGFFGQEPANSIHCCPQHSVSVMWNHSAQLQTSNALIERFQSWHS